MTDISRHYTKSGSGEPLVLLHGNGESGGYFSRQIDYFSRTYTVYALDTRGHGQSPRGTAPFTIRQFAQDLLDFLDQQEIQKAAILGFSDGGNIALTFALAHPGRVSRLILNGANLDPSGVKPSVQIPIVLGYKIASLFAKKSPQARCNAELLGLMVNEPNIPLAALAELHIPTLVIAGSKDMIKESHSRQIAQAIPGSRLEIIEGDHFIAAKNPEAFNRAVGSFLHDTTVPG